MTGRRAAQEPGEGSGGVSQYCPGPGNRSTGRQRAGKEERKEAYMENPKITDEQVELEIERLKGSPYVKLARKAERVKYVRRQRLYQLRNLEKRGRELAAQGVTEAELNRQIAEAGGAG